MNAQELQNPEKVSTIWVKNLNSIVNKMNNANLSMIGMKRKDAIKLDIIKLDKSETYLKVILCTEVFTIVEDKTIILVEKFQIYFFCKSQNQE